MTTAAFNSFEQVTKWTKSVRSIYTREEESFSRLPNLIITKSNGLSIGKFEFPLFRFLTFTKETFVPPVRDEGSFLFHTINNIYSMYSRASC